VASSAWSSCAPSSAPARSSGPGWGRRLLRGLGLRVARAAGRQQQGQRQTSQEGSNGFADHVVLLGEDRLLWIAREVCATRPGNRGGLAARHPRVGSAADSTVLSGNCSGRPLGCIQRGVWKGTTRRSSFCPRPWCRYCPDRARVPLLPSASRRAPSSFRTLCEPCLGTHVAHSNCRN
jgi:hypothetical protein